MTTIETFMITVKHKSGIAELKISTVFGIKAAITLAQLKMLCPETAIVGVQQINSQTIS